MTELSRALDDAPRGALAALLLLAACSTDPPADPSVRFLTPLDGDIVCGVSLAVALEVEGFELTSEIITDPDELPEGVGHAHIYVNGQYIYEGDAESFRLDQDLEPGEYQLKVDLANANHSPVEPYTDDVIYITVDAAACEG